MLRVVCLCLALLCLAEMPLAARVVERVNVSSEGYQANQGTEYSCVRMSADGRYVAFVSAASNLVPGDTNGYADAFVYDRQTNTIERVSVGTGGVEADAEVPCYLGLALSGNGRYAAFETRATNLATNKPANTSPQIYVRDRVTGVTTLVGLGSNGTPATDASRPSLSYDGRYVAFETTSSLVSPDDHYYDVYVHDRTLHQTVWASVPWAGGPANGASFRPSISADGTCVVFDGNAANTVPGDTNDYSDLFLRDLAHGTTERLDVTSAGAQVTPLAGPSSVAVSETGRYVAFSIYAPGLVPTSTTGGQIYLRDRQLHTTELISQGNGHTHGIECAITPDGRYIAFSSEAALVPEDTNNLSDVYVRDRQTGATELVSLPVGVGQANGNSAHTVNDQLAISADGCWVAFASAASNLVPADSNGYDDVFVARVEMATPPAVTAVQPTDGSEHLTVDVVTATFDKAMDAATLTGSTFLLTGPAGPVAGAVTYDSVSRTATFTPSAPLALGSYTVTLVSGSIRDTFGNTLTPSYTWGFEVVDVDLPLVQLLLPTHGSVVSDVVTIAASASDAGGIDRVEFSLNGGLLAIDSTAPYSTTWDTRPTAVADGTYTIVARAYDRAGKSREAAVEVVVDYCTFDDVARTADQWRYIEAIAREKITSGCSQQPPRYCPNSSITRGQMAVFLCRAAGWSPHDNPTPSFADVPPTSAYYGYVEEIYRRRVTAGCGSSEGLRYCPDSAVTRGQMAVFICRAAGLTAYSPATATFTDMPATNPQFGYVEALYKAGVTAGCGSGRYCPDSPVTRGQMAVFLVRAFQIALP